MSSRFLTTIVVFVLALQGCNTLQNTKVVGIQVLVPGKAKISDEYTKLAIKYNNANISFNPDFADYYEDTVQRRDTENLDSIASLIYFDEFAEFVRSQRYFDSVFVLNPTYFNHISLNDSLVKESLKLQTAADSGEAMLNMDVLKITQLINNFKPVNTRKDSTLMINPETGFYSHADLKKIAQETNADILLSLDFFAVVDGIYSPDYYRSLPDSLDKSFLIEFNGNTAEELVFIFTNWNFYDLRNQELSYVNLKIDTISWIEPAYTFREAKRVLPPRKDAIFNAANLAGIQFGKYMSPHWVDVERVYYQSGHVELTKTDDLIKENRWLEAAEIWKRNTSNKNKKIAAKSMFNLALACEMNGDIDAAMDWAVKSFYVFGNKNEDHAYNTQQYIRILGQRKLDIKKLEH